MQVTEHNSHLHILLDIAHILQNKKATQLCPKQSIPRFQGSSEKQEVFLVRRNVGQELYLLPGFLTKLWGNCRNLWKVVTSAHICASSQGYDHIPPKLPRLFSQDACNNQCRGNSQTLCGPVREYCDCLLKSAGKCLSACWITWNLSPVFFFFLFLPQMDESRGLSSESFYAMTQQISS